MNHRGRLTGICVSLLLIVSCSVDNPTNSDPDTTWTPGASSTYSFLAADEEVIDSLSKITFMSPGANLQLKVTKVENGPQTPLAATAYSIECAGADSIIVRIPADSAGYNAILAYGPIDASTNDSVPKLVRWFTLVPQTITPDSMTVVLPLLTASALGKRSGRPLPAGWTGFSHFAIVTAPAHSALAVRTAEIERLAGVAVATWLDSIDASLQPTVSARIATTHRYHISFDGNYYQGVWNILGLVSPRCNLSFDTSANIGSIAHEVGHYMSHMLCGDEAYQRIGDLAPEDPHGLADEHANRSTVTEEYAFFSEYFLTGKVNGSVTMTDPRSIFGTPSPLTTDIPSLEGFGAALLAMLHTPLDSIRDFSGSMVKIPRLNQSITDISRILSQGALTLDGLYNAVYNQLTALNAEKIAVNCEALGWSYHVKGKLIDSLTQNPVIGALVQSVVVTNDNVEYVLNSRDTTNDDGAFTVSRAFFGTSLLRFIKSGDTVSIPFSIDPVTPTTTLIDAGTLYMPDLQVKKLVPSSPCAGQAVCLKGRGFGDRGPDSIQVGSMMLVRLTKPYYAGVGTPDSVWFWMPKIEAASCQIRVFSEGMKSNAITVTIRKDSTMTFTGTRSIPDPTPLTTRKVYITMNWFLTGTGDSALGNAASRDSTFQFYLQCGAFNPSKLRFSSKINRDTSSYTITEQDSSYTIYRPLPGLVKPPAMTADTANNANAVLTNSGDSAQVTFQFDNFTSWVSIDAFCSLPVRAEQYNKKDSLISAYTITNDYKYFAHFGLESRYYW